MSKITPESGFCIHSGAPESGVTPESGAWSLESPEVCSLEILRSLENGFTPK